MVVINGKSYYGIIYKIECLKNKKIYIGQSIHHFDDRYKNDVMNYTHNKDLREDMIRYGTWNFKIDKVIDVANSKDELDKKEIYWIDFYDSYYSGYNYTKGGQGKQEFSEEKELQLVADLWNNNPLFITKDISNKTGYPITKVRKLLKLANELNMCDYDDKKVYERKSYEYIKHFYFEDVVNAWNIDKYSTGLIAKKINIDKGRVVKMLNEANELGLCDYNLEESNKRARNSINIISEDVKEKIYYMWNEQDMTPPEINRILDLKSQNVLNILKEGAELGLCDYSIEKSKERGNRHTRERTERKKEHNKNQVIKLWNEGWAKENIRLKLNLSHNMINDILLEGTNEGLCIYTVEEAIKRANDSKKNK